MMASPAHSIVMASSEWTADELGLVRVIRNAADVPPAENPEMPRKSQGAVNGQVAAPPITVVVTWRALRRRLERALRAQGQRLRTDRHSGSRLLIDVTEQKIVEAGIDLMVLGRRVGCLQPWETLMDDPIDHFANLDQAVASHAAGPGHG
jgi:hypothetical protein